MIAARLCCDGYNKFHLDKVNRTDYKDRFIFMNINRYLFRVLNKYQI